MSAVGLRSLGGGRTPKGRGAAEFLGDREYALGQDTQGVATLREGNGKGGVDPPGGAAEEVCSL